MEWNSVRLRLSLGMDQGTLWLAGASIAVDPLTISVAITDVSDDSGLIQGTIAANGITDDPTPKLTGSLSAPLAGGESVAIFHNGTVRLGFATVSGQSWTFTPSLPAAVGTRYSLTARVIAIGGGLGAASPARAFVLDTTPPTATATITAVADNVGLVKGTVVPGGRTDDATPTLSGGLSAPLASGHTLRVFHGTTLLGSATVNNTTRRWTYSPASPLKAGSFAFSVAVADAAGNPGRASSKRSLTITTTPPTTTAVISRVWDDVGLVQGVVAGGGRTDDTTPTLSGTLSARLASGGTLRVFNGTTLLGSATVNNVAKTWTYTPSTPLSDGPQSFRVSVAGNRGIASAPRTLSLDTTPPTLTISSSVHSLKAGETAAITFTFSEDPGESFAWDGHAGDVRCVGGLLSPLSGTGLTRTAVFTPFPDSNVPAVITVPEGSFTDAVGHPGTGSGPLELSVDTRRQLYDATLPELPDGQGWLAFGAGFAGRQSPSLNGVVLDSMVFLGDGVGYSNHTLLGGGLVNSAFPALDRDVGFSLDLRLRLIDEVHSRSNRAGFSLTLLDQGPTPRGIEIGFWSNSLFSQAGGAMPFQSIAQVVNGVDTLQPTNYSLFIQDQSYTLLANNRPLLSGPLQDYSQAPANPLLPYNPYTQPNFLFLGDNTTSAAARVELGTISLSLPLSGTPEPDTLAGTLQADRLNGRDGNDSINGGGGADWLMGGAGSDRLEGGEGDDLLSGGPGLDQFVFGGLSPFNASALGVDSLIGFNPSEDRLLLSGAAFTALPPSSSLPTDVFATVDHEEDAASAAAIIVYNAANGGVFYNPNGTAPGFASTPEGGGQFLQLVADATGSSFPLLSSETFQIT